MAVEKAEFQLTLDQRPFEASMSKARRSTVGLTESTNKAGAAVGAAATSVSGLNTALGNATSTTNNMIGAAGNLATTFAAAGPLGLGIAAITTGVGLLIGAWEKSERVAREAAQEQEKAVDRLVEKVKAGVEKNKGQIVALMGIDETRLSFALLRQEQEAAAQQLAALRAQILPGLVQADLNRQIEAAEDRWFDVSARVAEAEGALEEYNRTAAIVARAEARRDRDAEARSGPRGGRRAPTRAAPGLPAIRQGARFQVGEEEFGARLGGLMSAEREREEQEERNEVMREAFAEFDNDQAARLELLQRAEDWKSDAHEAELARIEAERLAKDRQINEAAAGAMMLAAQTFALAEQIGTMLVRNEENVGAAILNLVAQQTGGFLVGEGVKLLGMAVTTGLSGNVPLAAFQAAAGLTLGSIGTGMKVGGAAALESAGGTLAGLTGGATAAATSSPTAGGGGSFDQGAGGGGLTVVYNVGVGAGREEVARGVAEGMRDAKRMGFA